MQSRPSTPDIDIDDDTGEGRPERDGERDDDDPIPHKTHREHDLGDEVEEAELAGDDLLELDEDDLKYAEGPDA